MDDTTAHSQAERIPDRDVLIQFVDAMFRNARRDGFVSFRVFADNGKSERPVLIQAVRLDDHEFVQLMLIPAQQAANWYEPAVFAPPVCTFKTHRNAKTDNIREGVAHLGRVRPEPGCGPRQARSPARSGHRRGRERRRMDERRDRRDREQGAPALAAEEARGHAGGAGHAVRGAFAGGHSWSAATAPPSPSCIRCAGRARGTARRRRSWRGSRRCPPTPRSISRTRWRSPAQGGRGDRDRAGSATALNGSGQRRWPPISPLVASALAAIPNDST